MAEEFIPNQSLGPKTPNPAKTPSELQRTPVKILVISSPKGVTNTIHTFYRLGYAQISESTKPQPTENPGEVMSVLRRNLRLD
ncbi:MAG: hypothetical protein WA919_29745 [Coleofasciculaceae cyanobacterium]